MNKNSKKYEGQYSAGILTFHHENNYGAVLQTVSLQDVLLEIGLSTYVLDYRPRYLDHNNALLKQNSFKIMCLSILGLPQSWVRNKNFNQFRNSNIKIAGKKLNCDSISLLANQMDFLITGSDQIWNPNITKGVDPIFFAQCGENNKSIKISYAASIGVPTLPIALSLDMKKYVLAMDSVSVREPEAKAIIGLDVPVVCDPVLLHDNYYWHQKAKKPNITDKYILVYSLSGYNETYQVAEELSKEKHLPVIEIRVGLQRRVRVQGEKIIRSIGPDRFLGLIENASYVVTDSFHGTAFSLIFEREMFVIPNKTKGGRMINLMNIAGLPQRIVYRNTNLQSLFQDQIDYSQVNSKIQLFRNGSMSFLEAAISAGIETLRKNADEQL